MGAGNKHIGGAVKINNLHLQRALMLKTRGYIVLNFALIET